MGVLQGVSREWGRGYYSKLVGITISSSVMEVTEALQHQLASYESLQSTDFCL